MNEQIPEGKQPKRRGRPRAYDSQAAIQQAMERFWTTGFSGTTFDEIGAATGMNRPSLYAAFGDKRSLYIETIAQYLRLRVDEMREALAADRPLDKALMSVYEGALSVYFSGDGSARGCFVIGTAVTESVADADIRSSLAGGTLAFDSEFEARFKKARAQGELKAGADPASLAILATATMHTIAIRARAGSSRAALTKLARKAVAVICG
jgi:AcrR family transcriptional regulator